MPPELPDIEAQIQAELTRLNLESRLPDGRWLMYGPSGKERFLTRLRTLQPGVTWRDILGDIPADPLRPIGHASSIKPTNPGVDPVDDHEPRPQIQFSLRFEPNATQNLSSDLHGLGVPYQDIVILEKTDQEYRGIVNFPSDTQPDVLRRVTEWLRSRPGTITVLGFYG